MNLGFDECLEETAPLEIPSGLSDDEKISVIKGRKRALKKKQMVNKLNFVIPDWKSSWFKSSVFICSVSSCVRGKSKEL